VVGGGLGEVEVEAGTAHSLVGSQLTGELMADRDNKHAYECGWTDPCVIVSAQLSLSDGHRRSEERRTGEGSRHCRCTFGPGLIG
jgi:aerobic-type carbon monoxide dehydrogenase small subunit (CoxS/CutS family)